LNILLIEQKRKELTNQLALTASPRKRLFYIYNFYKEILTSQNRQFANSYLPEFIEDYIRCLNLYESIGTPINLTVNILIQIKFLLEEDLLSKFFRNLNYAYLNVNGKYECLKSVLNGKESKIEKQGDLFIPLLEKFESESFGSIGLLETFTINIKEEKSETKFLITPSNKEIERAITEQIKVSWQVALDFVKRYFKTKQHHCVIIQFDHRYGEYVGNSLGTAITLEFIKELHRFYHSKFIFDFNCKSAVTGGLDKDGKVNGVSKEIIEKKTEIVFYSDVKCFVVNDREKQIAKRKLSELQKKYPKREIEIIGIEDIKDLMNRRNIISLKKEKAIVRSVKFVVRNKISFILFFALIIIVFYTHLYDFDTNPEILLNKNDIMYVQNKNGKELWRRNIQFNKTTYYLDNFKSFQKIVDINGDGINEVIISNNNNINSNHDNLGEVICLSSTGKIIWGYDFKDTIETNEMVHAPTFDNTIIDTVTILNQKAIAMIAKNELYPSAVYFLNLKTGKRIGPTMWHAGHLHVCLIKDFNEDGKRELVLLGINNSYERNVLISVNINEIKGQLPAEGKYKFKDLPLTKLNSYVLLPKSDLNSYFKLRFNTNEYLLLYSSNKYFLFYLNEGKTFDSYNILYRFDKGFKLLLLDPGDYFRVVRDSLVSEGKLQPPYTDTPEYKEILKKQIRYWNGKKFVTAEQYFKNKAAQ